MRSALTLISLFIFFLINPNWTLAQSSDNPGKAQFEILTPNLNSQPGQVKSLRIRMLMPNGFHAYADQFKIKNIDPSNYKIGQIKISPEVEFYDKHNNKNRKGLSEKGEIELQVESPDKNQNSSDRLRFDLKYQICSEQVCYLPQTYTAELSINYASIDKVAEMNQSGGLFSAATIEAQLAKNFFLTYILVFLAGILTSFTPCIFPMIPITLSILGHNSHNHNRRQNVTRSIFYVLGIALTYSTLGVIAALTGAIFGQALANKYVVFGLVCMFALMALSMWGAFEMQMPAFIRNRLGTGKSHGHFGALLMGLIAGIVASPCVGPVLVSILSFVSTTQNVTLGFTLLFTYALGLGLIFIALGFSSQLIKKLPKSGPWMEFIKFSLGLLMVCVALYYLKFIVPMQYWITITGITFVAISIWQGAFNFKKRHPFRQGLFIAVFVFSFTLTLLSIFKIDYLNPIFNKTDEAVSELAVTWSPYSKEAILAAQNQQTPVIIDFFAEWCAACHELEEKTYTHPEFVELSKSFKLLKVDATEDIPEIQAILKEYQIQGLPTVIFINKNGQILSDLTFTQFLEWPALKPKMLKALE